MTPAIRVRNLSKCYRIGAAPTGLLNATEALASTVRGVWQKLRQLADPSDVPENEAYWALREVEFDVMPGELLGVVGRNGAGKSTLLKLLSRITVPTSGRIELRGRLGSLLEVGTGFHPELTGRENIFLNGSILGMPRAEIRRQFDAIVAFADIGPFLDTPVKRYSSGMYVRLAFSVAAHLDPDILIVDEVLAVGDAAFQRKCVDRMTELTRRGRTVLFVSHNMQLVPQLCGRAVHLERGRVVDCGEAGAVVRRYLDQLLEHARGGDLQDKPRTGDGRAKFTRSLILDFRGNPVAAVTSGDDFTVRVEVDVTTAIPDATLAVTLNTLHGTKLIHGWTPEVGFPVSLPVGRHAFECRFTRPPLWPGHTLLLGLEIASGSGQRVDNVDKAMVLDVLADSRHSHLATSGDQPAIVCEHEWRSV